MAKLLSGWAIWVEKNWRYETLSYFYIWKLAFYWQKLSIESTQVNFKSNPIEKRFGNWRFGVSTCLENSELQENLVYDIISFKTSSWGSLLQHINPSHYCIFSLKMNNRHYASWKGQEYCFSTTHLPPLPSQQYKMEFLCSKHHSNNICMLQTLIPWLSSVHGVSLYHIHYCEIIFPDRIRVNRFIKKFFCRMAGLDLREKE